MELHVRMSRFDNNKLVAFGNELYNAIKGLVGFETVISPFQNLLTRCTKAVNDIIEKTKAKEVSQFLKTADNRRDNNITGLVKLADACRYHPDEAVRLAATQISQLLDKLGNIQEAGYDAESTMIKNLLTDLKGDYAPQATLISANPFVTDLDAVQTEFDTYRQQQLAENADLADIESMSSIRREFEVSIRSLLTALPALYLLNPTNELKTALDLIEQTISKYNG